MASKKLKTIYGLFFFSFLIWLFVIVSLYFQSENWITSGFSNSYLFLLFFGSSITATISSSIIALNYLGLGRKFKLDRDSLNFSFKDQILSNKISLIDDTEEIGVIGLPAENETIDYLALSNLEQELSVKNNYS